MKRIIIAAMALFVLAACSNTSATEQQRAHSLAQQFACKAYLDIVYTSSNVPDPNRFAGLAAVYKADGQLGPCDAKSISGAQVTAWALQAAKSENTPAATSSPTPAPAPSPTMVSQTESVVFAVTGSGNPSIDVWGSNVSTNDAGIVSLPWQASMALDGGLYYAVDAQLQGWGSIQATVSESVTTKCSNGVVKTESFPMANGSASGGYAIATAEYVGGDPGNQYQAESDAGC